MYYTTRVLLLFATLFLLSIQTVSAEESLPSIVVIDFTLQDDMVPGPGMKAPGADDVARRTKMIRDYFVSKLKKSRKYRLIGLDRDTEEYQDLLNSHGRLFQCKRCIVTYGRDIKSDYVLHGWVQRVSNLIINFNVEILHSESGKVYDRATIDTRGNTDKSWMDGVSYLERHLLYGL
jgi:hypothetical protein